MKKVLLCASILALAVSCTDNEFDSLPGQKGNTKGISFEAAVSQTADTRSGFELQGTTHKFFWHAETDRINIWSTNTKQFGSSSATTANAGFTFDDAKKAQYKATQSAGTGVFTGIDDDNILEFADAEDTGVTPNTKESRFLAVYPNTVAMAVTGSQNEEEFEFSSFPSLATQQQDQIDGNGVAKNLFMYSFTKATKGEYYDAVGQKLNLEFVRPFSVAAFSTKNYLEEYGNLTKITLETKGYGTGSDAIKPSALQIHSDATFTFNSKTPEKDPLKAYAYATPFASADSAKIVLNVGTGAGLEWSDNVRAYMAMNNVDRVKAGFTATKKETVVATYNFANIDLVDTLYTANNWTSGDITVPENKVTPIPALDFNKFNYLVTKSASTTGSEVVDRLLVVNKGTFSAIFADEDNVKWDPETEVAKKAPVTQFKKIICNVPLTPAEILMLQRFTNLETLELNANTEFSLPTEGASLFGTNSDKKLQSLVDITFKEVATIAAGSLVGFETLSNPVPPYTTGNKLTHVRLPKYKFDEDLTREILNPDVLELLDMSGVATMQPAFPSKGFDLAGYAVLDSVTVQKGLEVGPSAFKGTTALKALSNAVNISSGSSAFENSGIKNIKLTNAEIPSNAFKNSAIEKVLADTPSASYLFPTFVGNSAFEGATGLVEMNLSKAEYIGESAFEGATALTGTDYEGRRVLIVGAEDISDRAFAGATALIHVLFTNATSFGNEIFTMGSVYALKEVKFEKVFATTNAALTSYSNDTFGDTPSQTTLYVSSAQTGTLNQMLTLTATAGTSPATTKITFSSIQKNK